VVFALTFALGASIRLYGLAERSLWGDEFCTWKVAQMPLGESLRWQPELTKPPLYQFAVRAVQRIGGGGKTVHQDAPYGVPGEWHLRLPAAVCGALAVAAMWWLGSIAGGWMLGAAAALLFAVNSLQIGYSQEARPYSMLVLGSIVSTKIWYRLNANFKSQISNLKRRIPWLAIAYILVAAATSCELLVRDDGCGTGAWAARCLKGLKYQVKSQIRALVAPATVMVATVMLCVPMLYHFLRHRTSVFQGLDWIAPPTVHSATKVLGEITFEPVWVWALLVPAVVVLVAARTPKRRNPETSKEDGKSQIFVRQADVTTLPHHHIATSPYRNFCGLLLVWLLVAWGGLLVISWVAHPAMVARYALPAAAPAILLPLIVLHRLDRRLPLLVAGLFVIGTAPEWVTRIDRVKPGFREMVAFLEEYADPQREAVVVVIERTTSPGWEEMDLLGFEYYRISSAK
jgi:hypothetical protein